MTKVSCPLKVSRSDYSYPTVSMTPQDRKPQDKISVPVWDWSNALHYLWSHLAVSFGTLVLFLAPCHIYVFGCQLPVCQESAFKCRSIEQGSLQLPPFKLIATFLLVVRVSLRYSFLQLPIFGLEFDVAALQPGFSFIHTFAIPR